MVVIVKRFTSVAARTAALSGFLGLLERGDRRRANLLRVLTYHRVAEPEAQPTLGPRLISATPKAFDQQMDYLAANYRVVSMQEVLDAHRGGFALPPRALLITFDDAYRDFAEHAWPTLRRYGLPATLFVATAFPDQPHRVFWWDRLYQGFHATARREELDTPLGRLSLVTAARRARACNSLVDYVKTLPHNAAMELIGRLCEQLDAPPAENHVLGWGTLRRLAFEGVTLGAHTRTHPLMNRLPLAQARAEAGGSLADLRQAIGLALPIFAYPAGGVNGRVADALKREGLAMAFTTRCGVNDMEDADPLLLQRINVGRRTTPAILRARLLAYSMYLQR